MTKIAKLVCVSLMTRVIVDESATEIEILEKAKQRLISKFNDDGILDNVESIENDEECPYDPEFDGIDVKCLDCGFEFISTKLNTNIDTLGKHCLCPKCSASFDIEDYSKRSCATCSLGQEGKCELSLELKCVTYTNNEKHGDYWIDRDEGE